MGYRVVHLGLASTSSVSESCVPVVEVSADL